MMSLWRLMRLSDPTRVMTRGMCCSGLTLAVVLALPFAALAERVQIAQIDVTAEMLGLTADVVRTPIPVWDLSFSPDGSMLAIGAGMYLRDRYSSNVVLIVSA